MDKLATALATAAHAAVRAHADADAHHLIPKAQRAEEALVLLRVIRDGIDVTIIDIVAHANANDLPDFLTWLSFHVATEEG